MFKKERKKEEKEEEKMPNEWEKNHENTTAYGEETFQRF